MEKSNYPKGKKVDALLNEKFYAAARDLLTEELKSLSLEQNVKSVKRLESIASMCVNTFRKLQSEFKNGKNIDEKAFGKTIGTLSQMIGVKNHQLKKDVVKTLVG
jgi:hypothetical protein